MAVIAAVAATVGLLLLAAQLQAACYWTGGSCAPGFQAANSPTAWTDTYSSVSSAMEIPNGQYATLVVQTRPYPGASGYTFVSPFETDFFIKSYSRQNVQHRCYHTAAGGRTTACGFGT